MPEILPLELKLSPAGSVPAEIDQVYGVVPPVAVTLWLYGCPTVQLGRLLVVTMSVAPVARFAKPSKPMSNWENHRMTKCYG